MKCSNIECVEEEVKKFLSELGFNPNFKISFSQDINYKNAYYDKRSNYIYINLLKYSNLYNEWGGEVGLVSTYLFISIILAYLVENNYSVDSIEKILLEKFGKDSLEYLVFKHIISEY